MGLELNEQVTMLFHMGGMASEEEYIIIEKKGDVVTLDTDEDLSECYKFDINTGECINDNTDFGCSRTLKLN